MNCPGCGAEFAEGAVICVDCGFDTRTGQQLQQRNEPSIQGRAMTDDDFQSGHSFNGGKMFSGIAMMVGAIAWFVIGWMCGYIFFYPPILFFIGLFAFFKGLSGGE